MLILGINAYHGDSAACVVKDGALIAAAEEERFTRIKHWAGFPARAISYCLAEAGATLGDIHHVAINRDPGANLLRRVAYTLRKRPDPRRVLDRLQNAKAWLSVGDALSEAFPHESVKARIHRVEHHTAHLASAFLVSPFDTAAVASVDGFGDFASAAWGVGEGAALRVDGKVYFPHSLGAFYQALTQYLGFPHYGDEYKVMGLAPYGQPSQMQEMRQIVQVRDDGSYRLNLEFFRHHREKIEYEWKNGAPVVGTLFSPVLEELLGPARKTHEPLEQRHRDIARSVQTMYEEAFFHLLNVIHARYATDNLALAGGCAMNSVANGKVYRATPFKKIYVQSAAGDAGGAIGAAYFVWSQVAQDKRRFTMDHAYWGPQYGNAEVKAVIEGLTAELDEQGCSVKEISDEGELCRRTAQAISEGKVVGWFQGRMEWGPRALGNRSILCDPRRADMKDILNRKIKRRESFRPFAPSILREAVSEWFETDDDVPFMMQVYQIREARRAAIPAVTHVDGSGRLQTVHRHTNPLYYRLIETFTGLTGVPIVLNTSFNENEPVVCRPEEAFDCFLRTKMDVLVIGNRFLRRHP